MAQGKEKIHHLTGRTLNFFLFSALSLIFGSEKIHDGHNSHHIYSRKKHRIFWYMLKKVGAIRIYLPFFN